MFAFLAFLAMLAGCAGSVAQRAERAILDALPVVLGPAERYEAAVDDVDARSGRLGRIRVIGHRVARPGVPVLDRIEVNLRDVVVDRADRRIESIEDAQATVTLTAADLADYLRAKSWIDEPRVRFVDGSVVVSGRLRVPGLAVALASEAEFQGRLQARGSRLYLVVDALRLGDRIASPLSRGIVELVVNPLVDLATYAVPSRVDGVAVGDDAIRIGASGSRSSPRPRPGR